MSQIVTQDYCEAVQQLELEQDLRLQAEVFAHEVRPGPGSPCPWVLGGTGTHGRWESGGGLLAVGVPRCRHPNTQPTAALALDPERMGMLLGTHRGPPG